MGTPPTSARVLPLIPLTPSSVLLPGTTLRIPIGARGDVAAVLAKIYARAETTAKDAQILVGCVPLGSRMLSKDGALLIEGKEGKNKGRGKAIEQDPMNATAEDVFGIGCVAKVSGVQGRRQGELSLVVEGVERFRVKEVLQERPFFEAVIVGVTDEGMLSNVS
jgi:ATP-dependent Lon protease